MSETRQMSPVTTLKYSAAGLALTERFEGCKLTAYPDPATHGDPWTIGYGHTGPDVHEGLTWTQAQAEAQVPLDTAHAVADVQRCVHVPLTQGEFDALVDFAYNCGGMNLEHSTLLRLLNQGLYEKAAAQFECWDKANGQVMAGLLRRRKAEEAEFEGGTS